MFCFLKAKEGEKKSETKNENESKREIEDHLSEGQRLYIAKKITKPLFWRKCNKEN